MVNMVCVLEGVSKARKKAGSWVGDTRAAAAVSVVLSFEVQKNGAAGGGARPER